MESFNEKRFNISTLFKIQFKPEYANIFKKIKNIEAPEKNDIIISLLDGKWHSETELIRLAKKQNHNIIGPVLLGTIISSLNHLIKNNYVKKQFINGEMYYKLSNNYIGLTKAAFTKFRYIL